MSEIPYSVRSSRNTNSLKNLVDTDLSDISNGDLIKYDGAKFVKLTPSQPVFGSFRLDTTVGINLSVPENTEYLIADWSPYVINPIAGLEITNNGRQFFVPVDGVYNINLRLHTSCSPDDSVLLHLISINKNGTKDASTRTGNSTTTPPEEPDWTTHTINTMFDLLTTDIIEVSVLIRTNGGTFRLIPTRFNYTEINFTKIYDL